MSARETVQFSRRLQRQLRIHRSYRPHLRFFAVLLTLGEVLVAYVMFRRTDFIGAYAMAAYLAKEHVISRVTGGE